MKAGCSSESSTDGWRIWRVRLPRISSKKQRLWTMQVRRRRHWMNPGFLLHSPWLGYQAGFIIFFGTGRRTDETCMDPTADVRRSMHWLIRVCQSSKVSVLVWMPSGREAEALWKNVCPAAPLWRKAGYATFLRVCVRGLSRIIGHKIWQLQIVPGLSRRRLATVPIATAALENFEILRGRYFGVRTRFLL